MKSLAIMMCALMSLSSLACTFTFEDNNYSGGSEFFRKFQVKRIKRIMKRKGYKLVEKNASFKLSVLSVCDCNWEEEQKLPGSSSSILLEDNVRGEKTLDIDSDYIYSISAPKKALRLAIKEFKKELPECK